MIYAIVLVKQDSERLITLLLWLTGLEGSDLHAVICNEIAAVISGSTKNSLITDKANAIEYAGVIEKLEQHFPLLPMRFGSMMESSVAISNMLEKNYAEFLVNLQKVENKSEFGLKIFCDTEKLKAELISKTGEGIEDSNKAISESKESVFREYVNRKLKAHRLEELMLSYVDSIVAEFTGFLDNSNAVKSIRKMTTPTTIIDASFLLDKHRKDELIRVVEDMQSKYSGLNFILTGPWPPYSFVDIKLKQ